MSDFLTVVQLGAESDVTGIAHIGAAVLLLRQDRFQEALAHSASAQRLAPQAPLVARFQRAMPTVVYWRELHRTLRARMVQMEGEPAVERRVEACRRAAAAVGAINTQGVDPDASRVGAAWAACLHRLAGHGVYMNDPARVVEAIVRGANGDPLGTAMDMRRSSDAVDQELDAALRTTEAAGATLTARYGIKF